ncbi:MAG: hypothetical protein KDI62_00140 [Anaerolineae bacterium]|nr:hypothetical protein [Anaerolineae bacterium]
MFQFTLLFLEVILLGATAYTYWATRKLVTTSLASAFSKSNENIGRETEMEITEMTRNLTELLAELQAATDTAHQDIITQGDNLQQILGQAERAIARLRPLIDQAEDLNHPAVADQEVKTPRDAIDKAGASVGPALTLAQALVIFKDNLSGYGYSQHTIPWVTAYTRQFLIWLHGDNWVELPLSQVDTVNVNGYINHLKEQNCPADVIERTKIALKSFTRWADNWLTANHEPAPSNDPHHAPARALLTSVLPIPGKTPSDDPHHAPAGVADDELTANHEPAPQLKNDSSNSPVQPVPQANALFGLNRYQTALTLAEQGLDRPAIAAQTGLEQEAIRLLLTMGSLALVSR